MRRTTLHLGLSAFAATALVGALASGQPRTPLQQTPPARNPPVGVANAAVARPLTLAQAVQHLRAASVDEVAQGIDALTRIGTAEVIPPLVELIHTGLADDVLETVVTKFGVIGRPEAIDELATLLHHRRASVRQRALEALAQIHDPRVRPLLESGLRDSEGAVRSEAARDLGATNARPSVELLQRAFERNVPEAAESIGRLGDAAAVDRLLEAVGHRPLSVLLPGFRAFLDRRDVLDPAKLRIVEQVVSRSPTVQVRDWLQGWVNSTTSNTAVRARQRAQLAIRQIHDDAPATPTPPAATPPAATPAGGAR